MPDPNLAPSPADGAKLIARVETLERKLRALEDGSQGFLRSPATDQELLRQNIVATDTGDPLDALHEFAWAHRLGGSLLDLADPVHPTMRDPGRYAVKFVLAPTSELTVFLGAIVEATWPAPYPSMGGFAFALFFGPLVPGFDDLKGTADLDLTAFFNAGDEFRFRALLAVGSGDPDVPVTADLIVTRLD